MKRLTGGLIAGALLAAAGVTLQGSSHREAPGNVLSMPRHSKRKNVRNASVEALERRTRSTPRQFLARPKEGAELAWFLASQATV